MSPESEDRQPGEEDREELTEPADGDAPKEPAREELPVPILRPR